MKLSEWIAERGGRVRVANQLGVTPQAIHYWLTGKSTPEFRTIFLIMELSKGRVTPKDIIDETRARSRSLKARGFK